MASKLFMADMLPHKFHHMTSVALAGLVPASAYASPSKMSVPVDLGLAVAIPAHMHIGMNHVITDYAPKISKHPACAGAMRVGLLGMTAASVLGLTKLTLDGKGVCGTLKEFWQP